jgi:3D (Asp-Asp-Asp) domain-containing protein/flavin-binding protein dodecin
MRKTIHSLIVLVVLVGCSAHKTSNSVEENKNTNHKTIDVIVNQKVKEYKTIIDQQQAKKYKVKVKKLEPTKPQNKIVPKNLPYDKRGKGTSIGAFTITAYSNHFKSTGKRKGDPAYGITASGKKTTEGVTIAADWRVLPKGTIVWIEGVGQREVQDTGSAIKGKKIDLYFENENDAEIFGRQKKVKVSVIRKPDES